MPASSSLDALLARAASASPLDRIELRDPIAAHGEPAIDAMTDWLADPRLAAFAVRVLERIGREPACRDAVAATLAAVDEEPIRPAWHATLRVRSRTWARPGAGARRPHDRARSRSGPSGSRGRGVAPRLGDAHEPGERPFIWSEATLGRLRQGLGWDEARTWT